MKNFTPVQKLDLILSIFSSQKELITFEDLNKTINTEKYGHYVPKDELLRIVRKLLDDKFMVEHPVHGSPIMRYHISFDGYLFKGYERQKETDDLKEAIVSRNEMRIARNEHRLVVGTWLAGVVGVLLLLWQIFLYLYPVHKEYPYFFWHK